MAKTANYTECSFPPASIFEGGFNAGMQHDTLVAGIMFVNRKKRTPWKFFYPAWAFWLSSCSNMVGKRFYRDRLPNFYAGALRIQYDEAVR